MIALHLFKKLFLKLMSFHLNMTYATEIILLNKEK